MPIEPVCRCSGPRPLFPTPSPFGFPADAIAAWGRTTERSFRAMSSRPEWHIGQSANGALAPSCTSVLSKPFCDLLAFRGADRTTDRRPILLIPPMSGHYPTLIRKTVESLLPEQDIFVTAWRNARDVPLDKGAFDVEDFARYLIEFTTCLGPRIDMVAICQPVPLALAAVARMAERDPASGRGR